MNYFISTGELSGDLHASYIVEKIKTLDKDSKFYAMGGKNLRGQDVEIIRDIDSLAIMGFIEVVKNFSYLKTILYETVDFIIKNDIDRVILVDYGGFNLKLLEKLKELKPSIKVSYYIPPKVWIWGKNRVHKIAKADEILVIFPWEVEFYSKYNYKAIYFGNPFMEKYEKINSKGNSILLLPGSRKQEIKKLFPIMLDIVKEKSDETFILKLAKENDLSLIEEDLSKYPNLVIESEKSLKELCSHSKYALAASGTVILELALLGLPGIVLYKTSLINELIVRFFINLTYVSLPNLTLEKEVYKELLQNDCNKNEVLKEMAILEKNYFQIEKQVDEIRHKLDGKNITENYAKVIIKGDNNELI